MALLTRLVPPPKAGTPDAAPHAPDTSDASGASGMAVLIASVPWYPVAGAAVGLVAVAPLALGLAAGYPFVQAWLYLCLSLWSTRCLHWDGLADIGDAWGANATGVRFHTILKDSRIGAFGALSLAVAVLGTTLLAAPLCAAHNWSALVLAPIVGRVAALILAVCAPIHPGSTLGRLLGEGITTRTAVIYAILVHVAAFLLLDVTGVLTLSAGLALVIISLARLARREGGVSGDFFGTAIVLAEMVVMLSAL